MVRRYKREPFVVEARFTGPAGDLFRGEQLFVQCFLIGPAGQYERFTLQDGGIQPDEKSNDGVYTGVFQFASDKAGDGDKGVWTFFVIAQDVNAAQADMSPEEAAQYIEGMVVTHQLTVDFTGGICLLIPDGHVNVV